MGLNCVLQIRSTVYSKKKRRTQILPIFWRNFWRSSASKIMTKNQRLAKVALHLIAECNNQITLELIFGGIFGKAPLQKL